MTIYGVASRVVNLLARKMGSVTIPVFLYEVNWLSYCDRCKEYNLLGSVSHTVSFSKERNKFKYTHTNPMDCRLNKKVNKIFREIPDDLETTHKIMAGEVDAYMILRQKIRLANERALKEAEYNSEEEEA